VGCPTGFRFLNFRVINLPRHRQRRHECACVVVDATIVLIQISLIRSLTLSSPPLSLSLSLSLCVFHSPFLPGEGESPLLGPSTTPSTDMYEWAFNRLVMYCNRFVASESCTPLRDPLRKAHDIRNEISVYPFIWGICHRCALLPPPPSLSISLSLSRVLSHARSLARSLLAG